MGQGSALAVSVVKKTAQCALEECDWLALVMCYLDLISDIMGGFVNSQIEAYCGEYTAVSKPVVLSARDGTLQHK